MQKPYVRTEQRSRNKGSNNITDAEFRTWVIEMLHEFSERVDRLSENFNEDVKIIKMNTEIIKGNQSEMKNTLSEIKSILEGITEWIKKRIETLI